MQEELTRKGRALVKILRHSPEKIGVLIDPLGGWADVGELLRKANDNGFCLTRRELNQIVEQDSKKRFTLDGCRIRAAHGHSIEVDLCLVPVQTPIHLYHGTAAASVDSIMKQGLHGAKRGMVHLSRSIPEALEVGFRHSARAAVLEVTTSKIEGPVFRSDSGIWLTAEVPAQAITDIRFKEKSSHE